MHRTFTLGVCAMENKVESSPMKAILKLLEDSGDFHIIIFPEKMILEEPITNWPVVQCLIAFYSIKYPLEKAIEYVKLRKPVFLNDLEKQMIIRSRIDIYRELQACRIPHPNYLLVDHDLVKKGVHTFEEHYDYIIYNNVRLNKPFIEKPIDSDDHNNWIYYPSNAGGGCKKLFRKVQDRSSEYCPDVHNVRRNATYIYEEFMSTFGTDIKVYAVGTMFAHAEARKSPSLDGKVDRYADGKEVRYPVILTSKEKTIAYRIVDHFGQIICGFDILRTFDGPYVCDVNGWSFVKRNKKYHMDCSQIIRAIFLLKLQAKYNILLQHVIEKKPVQDEVIKKTFADPGSKNLYNKSNEELCSIIVVMRHADRKPKSKLKFYTKNRKIINYFKGRKNENEIKLKAPEELGKLSQVNQSIISELEENIDKFNRENQYLDSKLSQELNNMIVELNYHRHFQKMLKRGNEVSGINRKVQFKPIYKQNSKENKGYNRFNQSNEDFSKDVNDSRVTNDRNGRNEGNERKSVDHTAIESGETRYNNWMLSGFNSSTSFTNKSSFSSKWDRESGSDKSCNNDSATTSNDNRCDNVNTNTASNRDSNSSSTDKTSTTTQSSTNNTKEEKDNNNNNHNNTTSNNNTDRNKENENSTIKKTNKDDALSLDGKEAEDDHLDNIESVLVIAKWGGDLTDVGKLQAEDLGRRLRQTLYPVEGSGLIRLHSTFRHDFKIFSSDEGRCQITSAAFTKGILDLEGELTPILVAMTIRNKKAYELLNDTKVVKERDNCRHVLNELITKFGTSEYEELLKNMPEEDRYYYNKALVDAEYTKDDLSILSELIREYIKSLKKEETMWNSLYSVDDYAFHIVNNLDTIQRRWNHLLNKFHKSSKKSEKLNKKTIVSTINSIFSNNMINTINTTDISGNTTNGMTNTNTTTSSSNRDSNSSSTDKTSTTTQSNSIHSHIKNMGSSYIGDSTSGDATPVLRKEVVEDVYDYTKLSDIVDNIRYDLIHLHYLLGHGLEIAFEIYSIVERLSSVISPCEYGVTPKEKLKIGTKIAWNLLQKILHDVTYQRVCMNLSAEKMGDGQSSSSFGSIQPGYFDNPDNPTGNFDNAATSFEQMASNFESDIDFILNNDTSAASIAATSLVRSNTYLDSNKIFEKGACFIGGIKPTEMYLFGNNTNTENLWSNMSSYKRYLSISEDDSEKNKTWLLNSYSLWAHTKTDSQSGSSSGTPLSRPVGFDSIIHENSFIGDEKIPFDNNLFSLEKDSANNVSFKSPQRMVRSRYYVTSASHLFSIFNFFKYAHLLDDSFDTNLKQIENINDLHYLSHIVLRVWRSKSADGFFNRLEILVSSGAKDGFGQNYNLLEKNTKNQKNKYKRHVQRYKFQRLQSTNCIVCPFTLANMNTQDNALSFCPSTHTTNTTSNTTGTNGTSTFSKDGVSNSSSTDKTSTTTNKMNSKTKSESHVSQSPSREKRHPHFLHSLSLDSLSYPEKSSNNILDVYNLMTGNITHKKFKCHNCFLNQTKSLNNLILSTSNFHISTSLTNEDKDTNKTSTTTQNTDSSNKEEKEKENNGFEEKNDLNNLSLDLSKSISFSDRRFSFKSSNDNLDTEASRLDTSKVADEDSSPNVKAKSVPPYCELNTLVIMNRNFGLDRLKNFIQKAYEQIILNN